jgi:hypothetical protein
MMWTASPGAENSGLVECGRHRVSRGLFLRRSYGSEGKLQVFANNFAVSACFVWDVLASRRRDRGSEFYWMARSWASASRLGGDANVETPGFAALRRWTGRSAGPYGLVQLVALLGLTVCFPWCFALLVVRGVARLAWPVACALGSDVYRGASCSG